MTPSPDTYLVLRRGPAPPAPPAGARVLRTYLLAGGGTLQVCEAADPAALRAPGSEVLPAREAPAATPAHVAVTLLGGFAVAVDGRPVEGFALRRSADLVKILALEPRRVLPRDRILDLLWPALPPDAAAAALHKAAHHARRALGHRDALVLRRGLVHLAPGARVVTDVERFEAGDDDAYGGPLLPDDPYEDWALTERERLHEEHLRRRATAQLAGGPS
ncbi:MAG: hypothetical protein HZB46_09920 [Solirubrobacterales bacterium]|nr:hypothetical protein [Solirubrobacterales bacterium]